MIGYYFVNRKINICDSYTLIKAEINEYYEILFCNAPQKLAQNSLQKAQNIHAKAQI